MWLTHLSKPWNRALRGGHKVMEFRQRTHPEHVLAVPLLGLVKHARLQGGLDQAVTHHGVKPAFVVPELGAGREKLTIRIIQWHRTSWFKMNFPLYTRSSCLFGLHRVLLLPGGSSNSLAAA